MLLRASPFGCPGAVPASERRHLLCSGWCAAAAGAASLIHRIFLLLLVTGRLFALGPMTMLLLSGRLPPAFFLLLAAGCRIREDAA